VGSSGVQGSADGSAESVSVKSSPTASAVSRTSSSWSGVSEEPLSEPLSVGSFAEVADGDGNDGERPAEVLDFVDDVVGCEGFPDEQPAADAATATAIAIRAAVTGLVMFAGL
jgi:hypothetical protein